MSDLHDSIQRYAELAVTIGVNLQAGQRLILRAPLEAAPLVRAITAGSNSLASGDFRAT